MTTRVTEGARRERHDKRETSRKARGCGPRFSRARALPLLNLKKKRDCSQSSRLVPSRLLFIIYHSLIAHNTPFLPPPPSPKFSISIVLAFACDDCNTQEKLETIGYTKFWGSNKVYCGQCPTKMVSAEQKFVEVRLNAVAKRFKLATQSKATKEILRDDEGFWESLVDLTTSPRC